MDNKTIHLVHTGDSWKPNQINALGNIVKNYPSCRIHLVVIGGEKKSTTTTNTIYKLTTTSTQTQNELAAVDQVNATTSETITETNPPSLHFKRIRLKRNKRTKKFAVKPTPLKRKKRKTTPPSEDLEVDVKVGAQNLFNILLNRKHDTQHDTTSTVTPTFETTATSRAISSIDELLNNYPQIFVEYLSYNQAFRNSPLFFSWRNLNDESRLFAIRVLYLWQYAGISFDLLDVQEGNLLSDAITYKTVNANDTTPSQRIEISVNKMETPQNQLDDLIALGYSDFSKLPGGVVSIDENGLHMETKTSCHAFFGELLLSLRRANENTRPSTMIKKTIALFCKKSAVDSKHCASIRD